MDSVTEGSTAYLTVSPLDQNSNPAAPQSATYQVNDMLSGAILVPSTALTPSTAMQIVLTPSANSVIPGTLNPQTHVVTVNMIYGASDALNVVYQYAVNPLQF